MSSSNESSKLTVDFMFIDLQTCGRCLGTEDALDAAIDATRPALEALGLELVVNKTLVESEEHAATLRFESSPTIRVGDKDVAGALKESNCGDCGDVCGADTDCRVWTWRGQEYTAAPIGLLVEAILHEATSSERIAKLNSSYVVPENLKQFFAGKRKRQPGNTESKACCSSDLPSGCC